MVAESEAAIEMESGSGLRKRAGSVDGAECRRKKDERNKSKIESSGSHRPGKMFTETRIF